MWYVSGINYWSATPIDYTLEQPVSWKLHNKRPQPRITFIHYYHLLYSTVQRFFSYFRSIINKLATNNSSTTQTVIKQHQSNLTGKKANSKQKNCYYSRFYLYLLLNHFIQPTSQAFSGHDPSLPLQFARSWNENLSIWYHHLLLLWHDLLPWYVTTESFIITSSDNRSWVETTPHSMLMQLVSKSYPF